MMPWDRNPKLNEADRKLAYYSGLIILVCSVALAAKGDDAGGLATGFFGGIFWVIFIAFMAHTER